MILAVFIWGWLFHGWELRVGSRNRDYVDKGGDMNSLFEKIAKELQKEFKSKANIGEDFDHSGRKRIKEDISENPVEWKG